MPIDLPRMWPLRHKLPSHLLYERRATRDRFKSPAAIVDALYSHDPRAGECLACLTVLDEMPADLRADVEALITAREGRPIGPPYLDA